MGYRPRCFWSSHPNFVWLWLQIMWPLLQLLLFVRPRSLYFKPRHSLSWVWGFNNVDFEDDILGYNVVYSVTSPQMFRSNMRPPSSGSKKLKSLPPASYFLLDFVFEPEGRGNTFLWNVGGLVPNYSMLQSRRTYFSLSVSILSLILVSHGWWYWNREVNPGLQNKNQRHYS